MKKPSILVSGHTLDTPALEWTDGHILGNGDLGAVVWGSAESLKFGLSKHNVYNLESAYPHGARNEYTYLQMLDRFKREGRSAAYDNPEKESHGTDKSPYDCQTPLTLGTLELQILSGVNVFSFSQTLMPAVGLERICIDPVDRRKGYGQKYPCVTVEACVDSDANALMVRVVPGEGDPVQISWHYSWPQHISTLYKTGFSCRNAESGLFHAELGEESGAFTVRVTQSGLAPDMDASRFALSGVVTASSDHPAEFSLRAWTNGETEPETAGFETASSRTAAWWERFWSKSMLWYDAPRLNDLWAMGLYALGASTRPDKSAPNLQGLWNLTPRAIWHSDFHFNTNAQECHWACGPSNHPELAKALSRMLIRDWREELRLHAKEAYGVENAVSLGVGLDWKGRALGGWWSTLSLSNTAWTAITLWDQYLFDPDEEYLRSDLFPFLQECCRLYDAVMEKGEDGLYHTLLSNSPERTFWDDQGQRYSLLGRDCTINVATIRALYEAAACAARRLGEDDAHFADMAAHMPPFPQQDGVLIEMETGYFHDGNRPGVTRECHRHPSRLMPIFPSGLIGLNSPDDMLELGVRSFYDFFSDGTDKITGWSFSYLANIAARLGLGEQAESLLNAVDKRFILKGLLSAHNPLKSGDYPDALFQIEALMAIPAALNEMALQSTDGVIRVFPALPKGRACAFERLRARGGVLVSAQCDGERTAYVRLEPLRDGPVTLVSPWRDEPVCVNGRRVLPENGRLQLNTQAGSELLVQPAG